MPPNKSNTSYYTGRSFNKETPIGNSPHEWMDDYYYFDSDGNKKDVTESSYSDISRHEMIYNKKDGKSHPNPTRASGLIPLTPTSGTDLVAETVLSGVAEAYSENPLIGIAAGLAYGRYAPKQIDKLQKKLDKDIGSTVTKAYYNKAFKKLKDDPMLKDIPWEEYSEFPYSKNVKFSGQYSPHKGKHLRQSMDLEYDYTIDGGVPKNYKWRQGKEETSIAKTPEFNVTNPKRMDPIVSEWQHPYIPRALKDDELEIFGKGAFKFANYPLSWYKDTAKKYALQKLKSKKGSKKKKRLGRFLKGEWAENTARHEGRHFFQNVEGTDIENRTKAMLENKSVPFTKYPYKYTNRQSLEGHVLGEVNVGESYNTMNKNIYQTDLEINKAMPKKNQIPEYAFTRQINTGSDIVGGKLKDSNELAKMGISDNTISSYHQNMKSRRYYNRPIEIDARLEEILFSGEDIKSFKNLKKHGYSKDEIRDWVKNYKEGREKMYGPTSK